MSQSKQTMPRDKTGLENVAENEMNYRLVDVRSPQEFASGHIEGSTNVPLQSVFSLANSDWSRQDTLIVYCASGMRANQATELLQSLGFTNVVNARTVTAAFNLIQS